MSDYKDIVKSIIAYLDKGINNDVQSWEKAFAYAGFDPNEIARRLKSIAANDLVMLCVITVMRGTKITKILGSTEGSTYLTKLQDLVNTYRIVDTGASKKTRETVTLSRIIATFPLTTIAAASMMEASSMGIYYAACPSCPWLGLAGTVIIARMLSDKNDAQALMLGHVVVSVAVTFKSDGKTKDLKRAINFTEIINKSNVFDKEASKYVNSSLSTAMVKFVASNDFSTLMESMGISKNDIPPFNINYIN